MRMTQNTILITGGGTGIGRALAEAFHRLGNQVIIAGRSRQSLDETTGANPGMKSLTLDVADAESTRSFAARVRADFPALNVVIHSAGIMIPEDLLDPNHSENVVESTIATNLSGPMRLTAELLPLLREQPRATIITVSSGLAFVPMAVTPTYCATKAAIHSYTQSLRYQLKDTSVEVVEIIPPYVATRLMGEAQANDPAAMPLEDYIAETIEILQSQPTPAEVCVQRVYPLRFAAEGGQAKYEETFKGFNDAMLNRESARREIDEIQTSGKKRTARVGDLSRHDDLRR
jgi:uncharacterized oxidoreductase